VVDGGDFSNLRRGVNTPGASVERPVNWCELVLQEPDQAEDLEGVLLENVDLKHDTVTIRAVTPFIGSTLP